MVELRVVRAGSGKIGSDQLVTDTVISAIPTVSVGITINGISMMLAMAESAVVSRCQHRSMMEVY